MLLGNTALLGQTRNNFNLILAGFLETVFILIFSPELLAYPVVFNLYDTTFDICHRSLKND